MGNLEVQSQRHLMFIDASNPILMFIGVLVDVYIAMHQSSDELDFALFT